VFESRLWLGVRVGRGLVELEAGGGGGGGGRRRAGDDEDVRLQSTLTC